VVVDMNCFRRWGHNEMDDPTFTNPKIYSLINSRRYLFVFAVPKGVTSDFIGLFLTFTPKN